MKRILFKAILLLFMMFPVFGDNPASPGNFIEIRPLYKGGAPNFEISFISYYIKKSMSFSELDGYLKQSKYYSTSHKLYFQFSNGNYVVDTNFPWYSNIWSITFLHCFIEFNGVVFPNITDLDYYPLNYDSEFYKSFPKTEALKIIGTVSDLSFLSRLSELKYIRIETSEKDKVILGKMFRQYYEYITQSKTSVEGYVFLATPYLYPHQGLNADAPSFYMDPPAWYDGPDIAGVPAWLNENRVNMRKGPSSNAPVIKQLNMGDFVLIKGYSGATSSQDLPFMSEDDYYDRGEDEWIKVRLPDRTDGYIYWEYLTLKNPKYYPIEVDIYKNSER